MTRFRLIRRSLNYLKVAAIVVIAEQVSEVLFLGVSLAEHPVVVLAALGALGFPVPGDEA